MTTMKRFLTSRKALVFVFIFLLIAIELSYLAKSNVFVSHVSGMFWIGISILMIGFSWVHVFQGLVRERTWHSPYSFWFIVAIVLPLFLIYFDLGGITFTNLSPCSAAPQLSGLTMLKEDSSLGIFGVTRNGFPARQDTLFALPSYLFGRSIVTMRLANSLLYVGSYLYFIAALRGFLEFYKLSPAALLTAFAGINISLGSCALLVARQFDRNTLPLALILFFTAGILSYTVDRRLVTLCMISWVIGFFPYSGSAGLGGLLFAIVVLLGMRLKESIFNITILYGTICFFISQVAIRDRVRLEDTFTLGNPEITWHDRMYFLVHTLNDFAGTEYALVPYPLGFCVPIIAYLGWYYADYRIFLVLAWSLLSVVASVLFNGSGVADLWPPEYNIRRALIVLPPLAVAFAFLAGKYLGQTTVDAKLLYERVMSCSLVFMLYFSVIVTLTVRCMITPDPENFQYSSDDQECCYDIACINYYHSDRPVRSFALLPPLDYVNLNPVLRYLSPQSIIVSPNQPVSHGTYVFSFNNPTRQIWDERNHSVPRPFIKVTLK